MKKTGKRLQRLPDKKKELTFLFNPQTLQIYEKKTNL